MKKQIFRRLTRNLILTFLASCILTTLTILISYNKEMGSIEGNSGVFLFIIGGFVWSLIMTIFSTTVYLNTYDEIRNNKTKCFLTFFLLPTIATIAIILYSNLDMWTLYIRICTPYVLTQLFFYADFKKYLINFGE